MHILRSTTLSQYDASLVHGVSGLDFEKPGLWNMALSSDQPGDQRDSAQAWRARAEMLQALGMGTWPVVAQTSQNGCTVKVANWDVVGRMTSQWQAHQCDALITRTPEVCLMALYADCSPIILFDPSTPALGVVHAGWVGTLRNVVGITVKAMVDAFGTTPDDVLAYMGPTICPEHYTRRLTGEESACLAVSRIITGVWPTTYQDGANLHCDIVETNRQILQYHGVRQIEVNGACTYEHANLPSARRDDPGLGGPYRPNSMVVAGLKKGRTLD